MGVVLYYQQVHSRPERRELVENEPWTIDGEARFTLTNGEVVVESLNEYGGPELNRKYAGRSFRLGPDDLVTIGNQFWRGSRYFIGEPPDERFAPRDAREGQILAALANHPADAERRLVYADWLEENGYVHEAEVLRIEHRIWRADGFFDEPAASLLGDRLRGAASTLHVGWRRAVTRPRVLGCPEVACPRSWDRLVPEERRNVRRCASCGERVWYCESLHRAAWHRGGDERVVLDIVCELPAWQILRPAPPLRDPLFGLRFFARPNLDLSVEEVFEALGLIAPESEHPLPVAVDAPASPHVRSIFVRHAQGLADAFGVLTRYDEIRSSPLDELRVVFRSRDDELESWLRAWFGEPFAAGAWRVYGHWLLRRRADGEEASLWWYRQLPRWATRKLEIDVA